VADLPRLAEVAHAHVRPQPRGARRRARERLHAMLSNVEGVSVCMAAQQRLVRGASERLA